MMYGVTVEKLSSDSEQSDDEQPSPVTEESVREDQDLMLVPTIIDKVVLPKIAGKLCRNRGNRIEWLPAWSDNLNNWQVYKKIDLSIFSEKR